jgi:isopenicillin N synthase-like dioxygenase
MNTPITDLKTKGFVILSYPADLHLAVSKTIASWKKFCSLPTDVKKGLPYSNNSDGVGYEIKDGTGNKADRKENFDVTLAGAKWLETHIGNIKNPAALEFVQNATALVGILKPIVLDFARQSEAAFDLKDFVKEVEQGEDAFFVRFIHYFGDRKLGDETASAHADQSGFTLHLFESTPGLQCLTFDHEWIDMPVSEGETVIIPSMQMQLRSNSELKALCHRVVATPETTEAGRYSAVCFVQLKKTPKYDKDTHGRLQEKKPGFNYELSPAEFAGLFKR